MSAAIALLLLVLAAVALIVRGDAESIAGFEPTDFAILMAGAAFLVFLLSAVTRSYRGRSLAAVRDFAMWSALGLTLVALYSFREEIGALSHRVMGELAPAGNVVSLENGPVGERSVRIRRRTDGHFLARAQVNGVSLTFLIDTGATTVVLKQTDARLLGIDVNALHYSVPVITANGTTYAAHVRLRSVGIGPIVLDRVDALVGPPGALKESLLGMNFLNRLRSYEFSGDFLTLRG